MQLPKSVQGKKATPAEIPGNAGLGHGARRKAKWLVISSSKGGCGKTTTARNLSVGAAHDGLKVLAIDTDAQQALIRWATRRPPEAPNVTCRAIPLGELVRNFGTLEQEDYDLLVFDTPPGVESNPTAMRELLRRADLVIVPTQPSDDDIETAVDWMAFLAREDVKGWFLLNRVNRASRSLREARQVLLGSVGRLAPLEIRDLEDIRRTAKGGYGVIELRGSNGADDLREAWLFTKRELEFPRA